MSKIDILLATFNGIRFLQEQLNSIFNQSYPEWRLIAGDDGSTDGTLQRIIELSLKNPEKVLCKPRGVLTKGGCANFASLIGESTSQYTMFCDQDDVWLPNKISKTLAAMKLAEQRYGIDAPILIHTDLCVVDERLRPIAQSLWQYRNLSPELGSRLHRLLPQNVITGCTVMINRPLAQIAAPIPKEALMHDWWLALVAALLGHVVYLNEPTLLYRQHRNNAIGAKPWGIKRIWQQMQKPATLQQAMLRTMSQAQALLDRYRNQISQEQINLIEAYARLPFASKTERIRMVLQNRLFRHGAIRTAGFLAGLLILRVRPFPRYLSK